MTSLGSALILFDLRMGYFYLVILKFWQSELQTYHEITYFSLFVVLVKIYKYIVFVWSQYDGGNVDKEQLAEVPSKT